MTPPAACLKGHSGEKCLSKYVLDLDLKMQKHFLKHLELFFSLLQHQRGLGVIVVVVGVSFCAGKNRFFNVALQTTLCQSFHNIQPNKCKEKQKIGLRRVRRLATGTRDFPIVQKVN